MAGFRMVTAFRQTADGQQESQLVGVAEETAVAISYNGIAHAVMMATPADLDDFAIGFSLCEGIVKTSSQIRKTDLSYRPGGEIDLEITLSPDSLHAFLASRRLRNRISHGGCGICGVQDATDVFAMRDRCQGNATVVAPAAISRAVLELRAYQPLSRQTQATHAAAWAAQDGALQLIREDVGRHNAMDKLVGALLRDCWDTSDGFCVLTSRCSVELVQKAVTSGMQMLVCVSAPTTLAIDWATRARLTLVARARDQGFTIFANVSGKDDGGLAEGSIDPPLNIHPSD